ncbi:ABC transporter substrate-binding protein [Cobetia crustatorum]|uniref:ABC transporter substrate-binding protein n=1 Tax=Cobetia crustatorum TaxID=553385 RepID=UPI000469D27B|nr:ABC transporter substrate-binding protein [Cobetia crustatorum]
MHQQCIKRLARHAAAMRWCCLILVTGLCLSALPRALAIEAATTSNRESSNHAIYSPISATFINPGLKGERFWDMIVATMQAAAQDLNIRLEVLYADRVHAAIPYLINDILRRKTPPDYLVVVNDAKIVASLLPAIDKSSIKLLMIVNGLDDEQKREYGIPGSPHQSWIGSLLPDMEGAARRTARGLLLAARQQFDTPVYHGLALIGENTTSGIIAMNKGVLDVFAHADDLILDRVLEARWNQQDAQRLTTHYLAWMKQNGEAPHIIWAANDSMAIGAIDALSASGLTPGKDVFISGMNWSPEVINMVEDGRMLMTDGGHIMAGAWSMVMLRDYEDSTDMPAREIIFPMTAITRNNVEFYGPSLKNPHWDLVDFSYFTRPNEGQYHFQPLDVLELMINNQYTSSAIDKLALPITERGKITP